MVCVFQNGAWGRRNAREIERAGLNGMLQRPCNHLSAIKSRYPNVWKEYDVFLAGRGKDLPSWPGWCYCPLSAAYAIASRGGSITADTIKDVAILGALAAWRPTQGIYRFDKDVASAIMSTEIDGEVPCNYSSSASRVAACILRCPLRFLCLKCKSSDFMLSSMGRKQLPKRTSVSPGCSFPVEKLVEHPGPYARQR